MFMKSVVRRFLAAVAAVAFAAIAIGLLFHSNSVSEAQSPSTHNPPVAKQKCVPSSSACITCADPGATIYCQGTSPGSGFALGYCSPAPATSTCESCTNVGCGARFLCSNNSYTGSCVATNDFCK